jgi:hypothetical protein
VSRHFIQLNTQWLNFCRNGAAILGTKMPKQDWISVLKLAAKWQFERIKALAIEKLAAKLEPLDPIEQLVLGRDCDVPKWLHSGYVALATRSEALSLVEAEKVGWPAAICVCQIREEILMLNEGCYPVPVSSAYNIVEREFGLLRPIVETPSGKGKKSIGKKEGKKKKVKK